MTVSDVGSVATAVGTGLAFLGLILVFFQLRSAEKAIRAQALLKITDDWRNPEIYTATVYVHGLRQDWKSHPLSEWDDLARRWVIEHAGKNPNSLDPDEKRASQEWVWRRTTSQFLAKMGLMMSSGFLTADMFFGVVPEAGRLLAVLIPIELEIQKYWKDREGAPIAPWDRPFAKWEFNSLWQQYRRWSSRHRTKYELRPINWKKEVSVSKR